jgi:hypothetical protein
MPGDKFKRVSVKIEKITRSQTLDEAEFRLLKKEDALSANPTVRKSHRYTARRQGRVLSITPDDSDAKTHRGLIEDEVTNEWGKIPPSGFTPTRKP